MSCKKFFVAFIATIFVLTSAFASAASKTIDVKRSVTEVTIHQDVTFAQYLTWPEGRLKADIFLPNVKEKVPAIVFVPGGWWITAPKGAGTQLTMKLAEEGFAVANIEYRTITTANYIDIIGDVKAAVRYLRAHADELNIDKNKIAVMGASAGGYLASMVGATGGVKKFDFGENLDQISDVQAVVDFFGPSDLTKIGADYSEDIQKIYNASSGPGALLVNGMGVYKGNKGGSLSDTPETARDSNPISYIGKNTPPFLIMNGDSDTTVSPSQSKILYDALIEKGVDADHYVIKGGGHEFVYFFQPEPFKIIVDFLNKKLRK